MENEEVKKFKNSKEFADMLEKQRFEGIEFEKERAIKKAKDMLIEINKFKEFCKSMGYNLDESRMIQECLSVDEE